MASKFNFHPKKLSVMIAAVLGANINTSYASLLNYNIVTESGYAIGQTPPITYNSIDNSPTYSSTYLNYNNYGENPNTRGAAAGDEYGWMYSRAGGEGSYFSHYSIVTQSVELENNSGVGQNYNYSFAINFGSLSAYNLGFSNADEYSSAGYEVDILVNNVSLWQSAFLLTSSLNNGAVGTGSGTSLASYNSGDEYFSWPEYFGNLNLGLLNAGDSLTLSYSIKTFVAGNHSATCSGYGVPTVLSAPEEDSGQSIGVQTASLEASCNGYGYGGYGSYGYLNFNGNTYAQFGDPNYFTSTPIAFNAQNITSQRQSVDAPGSLALAGLGLAGLAFRRRKQKN
jgi:uncharacterized protein (TIGR03382 family)